MRPFLFQLVAVPFMLYILFAVFTIFLNIDISLYSFFNWNYNTRALYLTILGVLWFLMIAFKTLETRA